MEHTGESGAARNSSQDSPIEGNQKISVGDSSKPFKELLKDKDAKNTGKYFVGPYEASLINSF